MTQRLALNGPYIESEDGAIDQAVEVAVQASCADDAAIHVIHLIDYHIEFCLDSRHSTQAPGVPTGGCVHHDRMRELIQKIEAADGYILASPTNLYSVTALFKRFMERLVVYTYWPWVARAPTTRKKKATKKAFLIASSAAPGLMGHLFYTTLKQLKMTVKTIGAKPATTIFIGLMSRQEYPELSEMEQERLRNMVRKLI
jgi:multimeric flavodoxin WrbA